MDQCFSQIDQLFKEMDRSFVDMNGRFDELQHDIVEALEASNEIRGKWLKDHERRIAKLEQQRAAQCRRRELI
jgi:hypothetical protein